MVAGLKTSVEQVVLWRVTDDRGFGRLEIDRICWQQRSGLQCFTYRAGSTRTDGFLATFPVLVVQFRNGAGWQSRRASHYVLALQSIAWHIAQWNQRPNEQARDRRNPGPTAESTID
jgi:hypothetical protein